jgi:FAD dependent oxidoreductase
MNQLIRRRDVLGAAGSMVLLGALEGCRPAMLRPQPSDWIDFPRLRLDTSRITAITVCTRPFRAEGPRLDVERIGAKTVVHNYGHGGSGWSLSWGSAYEALERALATGEHDIAVIGCGAIGLTSALLLQRGGAQVTIYAKEMPPNVRSSLATGVWSPDSRICLAKNATPAFKQTWEGMARYSYRTYQSLLGLPGDPIEYFDNFFVPEVGSGVIRRNESTDGRPPFAQLVPELLSDLGPGRKTYSPGTHPFGERTLQRETWMMFNINAYTRLLISDYLAAGGRMEIVEFKSPADLLRLRQRTLVNATGYGARALFGDESVIPVRGQVARTVPQDDIRYGLFHKDVAFVPRRDGFVFQFVGDSDYYGYGDDTTIPDPAEAERAIRTIVGLFA